MSKTVLYFAVASLSILLFFGLINPNSPVMWMASTSASYAYLRLGLIAALAALLVTNPPRHTLLRASVAILSIVVAAWSLSSTYNNHMALLDTLAFLQFSISAGIVALELDPEEVAEKLTSTSKPSSERSGKTQLATT